jgi:hypothetical protein
MLARSANGAIILQEKKMRIETIECRISNATIKAKKKADLTA